MGRPPAIILRRVAKEYRRDQIRIPVLSELDLTVEEGEFLALMGPSGSGKTTLLNLIAGLDRPTAGEILVHDLDLARLSDGQISRWRSDHVGFIFQTYNLIPVLRADENVELPLLLTKLSRRERRERALTALRIVGLAGREDHYPRQLSGGQEQRVAIARAIVTDPYLLVADEPTGDLDRQSAEEILNLMEQLNREFEKTIVMVTHDPNAAKRATRILHLDKGQLVDDIVNQPAPAKPKPRDDSPAAVDPLYDADLDASRRMEARP
jgi:putative ABC transport system ATP-binding protein